MRINETKLSFFQERLQGEEDIDDLPPLLQVRIS